MRSQTANLGVQINDLLFVSGDEVCCRVTPLEEAWQALQSGCLPGADLVGMDTMLSSQNPFYEATVQATEEAVINALVANEEMVGIHGRCTPALPRERVAQLLPEKGVVVDPRSERP